MRKTVNRVIAFIVLLSAVFGCSSCQPTPEKPPVVSKNDGTLEKALFEGADESYTYNAPDVFNSDKEYAGGKAHITCDNTAVSVLKNKNYAVYSAKDKVLTAEDFQHLADVCFDGAVITKHLSTFSKAIIQEYMLNPLEKEVWELENGEYKVPDDVSVGDDETGETWDDERIIEETKKSTKLALDRVRNMYKNAPDAVTGDPFEIQSYKTGDPLSLDFTMQDGTVGRLYYIPRMRRLDVSLGEYMIEHTRLGSIGLTDLGDARLHREEDRDTVKVKDEDALSQADEFMQKMGMSDDFAFSVYSYANAYTMSRLMEVGSEWDYARLEDVIYGNRKTYRGVIYVRKVEGVPFAEFSSRNTAGEDADVGYSFVYERFIVWVGDNGVAGFSWDNPLEAEPLQESVKLIPFEDIKELVPDSLYHCCAGGHTVLRWVDEGDGQGHDEPYTYPLELLEANICELELRYMQVLRKDGKGEYLLLPVWCAYCDRGRSEYEGFPDYDPENVNVKYMISGGENSIIEFVRENYRSPALVLNAIDGSIISTQKGY